MLKKFTSFIILASLIMVFTLLSPIVFGWFHDATISDATANGAIIGSYFEYGDGSAEHPFGIAQPKQLYYFAWLQNLGYFNTKDGNQYKQVYFELSDKYDDEIDMASGDKQYIIPPVGTLEYPFIGHFSGVATYPANETHTQVTIRNLVIDNSLTTLTDVPNAGTGVGGAQVVGFFGIVGAFGVDSTGTTTTFDGASYTSAVNSISNFQLDSVTIKTTVPDDNMTLIGVVAGYVNGNISGVAVSDSTVTVSSGNHDLNTLSTENISDYGLVGYCEAAYKQHLNITSVVANLPVETQNIIYKKAQDEGEGFGGSVNMFNFYNRMYSTYHAVSFNQTHTTTITRTIDVNGVVTETESGSATDGYHKIYDAGDGGVYSFVKYASNQETDRFYYVYGDTVYSKTVNTTTYSYDDTGAFYIYQNGKYLNLSDNNTIVAGDTPVTKWIQDNNNYIYAVKDATSTSQNKYYLNNNGNSALQIGTNTNTNTVWEKTSDNITCTIGGGEFYLYCNGTNWSLRRFSFKIKGNGDYYLNGNNTGTLSASMNSDSATIWSLDENGYLYYTSGATTYYLRNNGGNLIANTSTTGRTVWAVADNFIKTDNYFLNCDNGTWKLSIPTSTEYYITDGKGNYLRYNNNGLTNTTNINNATKWVFENNNGANPSGTIKVNNANTYLRYNNGLTTGNAGNAAQWGNDGNGIYLSNNTSQYLVFNGTNWVVQNNRGYTISYEGNYLNITSTSSIGTGASVSDYNDSAGHTIWVFSNYNGTGTISTVINGTTYYLYGERSMGWGGISYSLSLSNRSSTNFASSSNSVYISNDWIGNYYLKYSGSSWAIATGSQTLNITANQLLDVGIPLIDLSDNPRYVVTLEPEISSSFTSTTEQVMVSNTVTTTESIATGSNATYFPINAKGNETFNSNSVTLGNNNKDLLEASDTNTGYVVSGNQLGNQTTYGSNGAGDIRISQYSTSDISNSYTNGVLWAIAPHATSNTSGWYLVQDNSNKNTTPNSTISASSVTSGKKNYADDLNFMRYEDARSALGSLLQSNGGNIYGLHFMNATINKNNYVTIPNAIIYGDPITNLKVPTDCIDFNVKRKGFVTVFAGSYFSGNNAFFSLHEIFRDNDYNITEIKEISKIYHPTGTSNDYVYEYTDGTFSSDSAHGALAFDMAWMTNPGDHMVQNAVYYFEIPVNGGEFALGSVSGKTGAYLFYLDIAANAGQAEDKDRRTITEQFKYYDYDFELPKGVQLVPTGNQYNTYDEYETVVVEYLDGFSSSSLLSLSQDKQFAYTDGTYTNLLYTGGVITPTSGNASNVYYPNGYKIKYVENIVDKGRESGADDIIRIEYIDTFDQSGAMTGNRTVDIYAGVDITDDESELIKIISFTYSPTTASYADTVMRCVRAVSIGSFNIIFNQNVRIIETTVTNADVRVNFIQNFQTYDIVIAKSDSPVTNQTITGVSMAYDAQSPQGAYVRPAVGPELFEYYYYRQADEAVTEKTVEYATIDNKLTMVNKNSSLILSPKLTKSDSSPTQTLDYIVNISLAEGATGPVTIFAKLISDNYDEDGHFDPITVACYVDDAKVVSSDSVTISLGTVKINDTTLSEEKTKITINASQGGGA